VTRSQFKVPTDKSGNALTRNEISKEWNGDDERIKEARILFLVGFLQLKNI